MLGKLGIHIHTYTYITERESKIAIIIGPRDHY